MGRHGGPGTYRRRVAGTPHPRPKQSPERKASPRPRTRLAKDDRRAQLLAAAERAFLRGGYHGTHVDDVIREAGIARGTFYLHFESKHAVFSALVDRMLTIFLAAKPVGQPGSDQQILAARLDDAARQDRKSVV